MRVPRLHRVGPAAARLLVAAALLLAAAALGVRVRAEDSWREKADVPVRYEIRASLRQAPDGYRIRGHETVTWTNTTTEPASALYFHLYANAFRDRRSSFLRERERDGRALEEGTRFGGVDILEMTAATGESLTPQFVSPDDGNPDDQTVVRVPLSEEVSPGGSVSVNLRFITRLPSVIARMGEHEGFVMAAQWFPKLGRFLGERSGRPGLAEGWHCHQYHLATEFHADFADYRVELKTPTEMIVSATGTRLGTASSADESGLVTHVFEARSVVDFAWTAHDDFLRLTRKVRPAGPGAPRAVLQERTRLRELLGEEDSAFDLPEVEVLVLLQKEHEEQADRHFRAAEVALGLFGMWFGPYPYPRLVIVDPAFGADAAGGMEYPTLVTAGTRIDSPPETLRPEGVTVHEIGHQWFMNLFASDETTEAWLDEGLTTYFTGNALALAYGPGMRSTTLLGHTLLETQLFEFPGLTEKWPKAVGLPDWATPPDMEVFTAWRDLPPLTGLRTPAYVEHFAETRRASHVREAGWDPGVQPGWHYVARGSYGSNVYSRAVLYLHALRTRMAVELGAEAGEAAFWRGMRHYARTRRFTHPTTDDFLADFRAGSGFDPAPLFNALMRTDGTFDYAVESIRNFREPPESKDAAPGPHRAEVVVRRRGEVAAPVRLTATISSPGGPDTTQTLEWDGTGKRWKRFEFDGRVVRARLDPDGAYLADLDRTNDSRVLGNDYRAGMKWAVRFMAWLENALLSYGRFF